MFLKNPLLKHHNRCWHFSGSDDTQSTSDPPVAVQKGSKSESPDQLWFAIEANAAYNVVNITVVCSPKGKSGAGQASPFRDGSTPQRMLCMLSSEPLVGTKTLKIHNVDRVFRRIGPYDVYPDTDFAPDNSEYELTIIATLVDDSGSIPYQFSYDPEMDVNNNP